MRDAPCQQSLRHWAVGVAVQAGSGRPVSLYPDVALGDLDRGNRVWRLCPDHVTL